MLILSKIKRKWWSRWWLKEQRWSIWMNSSNHHSKSTSSRIVLQSQSMDFSSLMWSIMIRNIPTTKKQTILLLKAVVLLTSIKAKIIVTFSQANTSFKLPQARGNWLLLKFHHLVILWHHPNKRTSRERKTHVTIESIQKNKLKSNFNNFTYNSNNL